MSKKEKIYFSSNIQHVEKIKIKNYEIGKSFWTEIDIIGIDGTKLEFSLLSGTDNKHIKIVNNIKK